MAAEESLSRLDSQVSTDASPSEINSVAQESGQTSMAGGKDVRAEIDTEESKSNFDGGTRHMELEKYKNLMPSDMKIDYYDVLVLYSEVNKSDARTFCDHLKTDIKLENNESLKAVLYDECVPQAGSKFNLLKTALERCTYVFCYITKEFSEDKWTELSKDECLMEAIENEEKKWCVVPVITVPTKTANFKIPFGLRSLKGINYYENDQYYRRNVRKLIKTNLHRRLNNERKQIEQQFNWIEENKGALHFGNEDISCQENKEKLGTKQQEKEKTTEQGVNEGLISSQPVFLQKAGDQSGTDLHTQPTSTSFERRSDDELHYRGHFGESISEEDDSACINSIKSTDQLSQGGSMPLLDGPKSAMVSSSINSCTEEKMPIQEESCTQATSDIQPYREGTYSDNGYHSDQSVEAVNQTDDPSDNICIKSSADQLYQEGSSNLMQPAVHKFAGSGNQSDMPLLDDQDSTLAYSLEDIGLFSQNPDVDGTLSKSDDQSQDTQMTPVNQSPSCWGTEVTVEEEEEQSLETKSKDESMSLKTTKEEKEQHLPKTVNGDISEILPFIESPCTDIIRYHVAMRPATPLLAKTSRIPPVTLFAVTRTCLVQSDPTSAQCTESGELD